MTWEGIHEPVLLREVLECLNCRPGCFYVDGTVGLGGHAEAILDASSPDGRLLGVDRDPEVLDLARQRLSRFGDRVRLVHENFRNLPLILNELGIATADGILLDIGLSSFQLSRPERGFSFQSDGPLDMRMDNSRGVTAEELVNRLGERELADLIWRLGEEPASRRIARMIVRERSEQPIRSTCHLAELVRRSRGGGHGRIKHHHPATRTFQALRIAVNEELESLQGILRDAVSLLAPGGRMAVISFHSLEDRMVKNSFRSWAGYPLEDGIGPEGPACGEIRVRLVSRKALKPGEEEIAANPRSRSARLRVVERL